jgi:hypothetical protein
MNGFDMGNSLLAIELKTNTRFPTRLEKRPARVAREQGVDQERLRRWVSFLALCGVLEKGVSLSSEPKRTLAPKVLGPV